MKELISIIAILMSLNAMGQGRYADEAKAAREKTNEMLGLTDTTSKADTITLTAGHADILPKLLQQQAEIQRYLDNPEELKAIHAQINEKIMILLTGYVDSETLKAGKIQLSQDQKKIIVQ